MTADIGGVAKAIVSGGSFLVIIAVFGFFILVGFSPPAIAGGVKPIPS